MRLIQVAQRVEELGRARAFYEELLGQPARAQSDPPGLLFLDLAGVRLLLERGAPSAVLYLHVDDLWARIEALPDSGVAVVTEPHMIFTHADSTLGPTGTDEWQAFVRDSEGNLLGLVGLVPTG